jgi:K+-transporting ATPase ATPase C chain
VDDARGVPAGEVRAMVEAATADRDPGFVGAPHVRVLALDREFGPV